MLDSAGSTLVEWGRQQQQHDIYDAGGDNYRYDVDDDDNADGGVDDGVVLVSATVAQTEGVGREAPRNGHGHHG